MNSLRVLLVCYLILFMIPFAVDAQKKTQKPVKKSTQSTQKSTNKSPEQKKTSGDTQKEVARPGTAVEENKVRDIISFLQYMLNTLGNNQTSSRDKDVLITQSYSKIFRDAEVQVEDDLDEERKVITNKDIVAYLKDVDFFFQNITFEFVIEDIKQSTMPNGELFYKVSLTRNIKGTNSDGNPVNNTMPRFIEINYNPDDQDLKIVSIYTNQFNEKEALTTWWKELSYEWQSVFRKKLNLTDSVDFGDIKDITSIEELDLSNNEYIQSIEPLAQIHDLKLLNLASTGISDLTPIRNLTELIELDISGTKVFDLTPLKYAHKLQRLNINDTEVRGIAALEGMNELKNLEMRATHVFDFSFISNLPNLLNLNLQKTQLTDLVPVQSLAQLMELNISATPVQDLNGIKELKNLVMLNIDSTRIKDLGPLTDLINLKVLSANYTLISNLAPLAKLQNLEKVYCDQTAVTRDKADAFMSLHKKALVVFDSKDLKAWWDTLPLEWQNHFMKVTKLSMTPGKEELARITNLDSINVSSLGYITSLDPLSRLRKLETVIARETAINDLSPLREHKQIRYLDISETQVSDLSILNQFNGLKILRADKTKIESIEPLFNISSLEELYVDQTFVHDIIASEFLEKNPKCLIVYKTSHLNRWWQNISPEWKEVFRKQMANDTTPTRENLHRLVEREQLIFNDAPVNDLSVLGEFVQLKKLDFSATAIRTIPPLENLKTLKSLRAANSPLQNIETLKTFTSLEELDISNTPVDELKPVGSLVNLRVLNCGGTQIKKIDPLQRLDNLESFDCSNTRVSKLDPVMRLSLRSLKCYNTKIKSRDVEKFRERNPDCHVVFYR